MVETVNSPEVAPKSRRMPVTAFDSERSKKANAVKYALPPTVPDNELESFRALRRDDKEEILLDGLLESEFIAQYLDRQQMLSPNKKDRMQTGFAVRVGIYNDKRNKQGVQSVPQNLIINLFNGASAGSKLSQALSCHAVTQRTAQAIDVVDGASPQQGDGKRSDSDEQA